MENSSLQQRVSLAGQMLSELKSICSKLGHSPSLLGQCANNSYQTVSEEYKSKIQNEINRYTENINKIKTINLEITNKINDWYDLVKNDEAMKNIVFPLKYYRQKKELKKAIKKANDSIMAINIENRFIEDRISTLEHEIEMKSVEHTKSGDEYASYEGYIKKRDAILEELEYLLPSIPDVCPVNLDILKIDSLIDKLQKSL